MLVINPMVADSRVDKEAHSLGAAGHDVTVVATLEHGLDEVEDRGTYVVRRLPYRRVVKGRLEQRERAAARRSRVERAALQAALHHAPRRVRLLSVLVTYLHLLRVSLRRVGARLRWLAGGGVLKLVRSRILPAEYWGGLVSHVPDVVDRCDVIHAHDLGPLAAAVRLADRWDRAYKDLPRPRVIYDSHELYVEQNTSWTRLEKRLWAIHERRWIRRADAVITVSPGIARELRRRHRLRHDPLVVYNSPPPLVEHPGDVRTDAGLDDATPLVVYVGGVKPGRGVDHLIPALALRPDVHLAVLGAGHSSGPHLAAILAAADDACVRHRIHVLPPVPAGALATYLASADAGIHPMEPSCLNHELALPNKLFDYVFAGLPVAVSDLAEMRGFVAKYDIGVTFDPACAPSVADALGRVIDDRARYRPSRDVQADVRDRFGWPKQEAALLDLYRTLLTGPAGAAA